MGVPTIYKVTGYVSVFFGILAALCISRVGWIYYGMMFSVAGFITSLVNVFLNAKYFSDSERFPLGYFGMFLSSLPVIFLLLIIFKFRK